MKGTFLVCTECEDAVQPICLFTLTHLQHAPSAKRWAGGVLRGEARSIASGVPVEIGEGSYLLRSICVLRCTGCLPSRLNSINIFLGYLYLARAS